MSDRAIRIGGLLRCCIQSVHEYEGEEIPGVTVIPCTVSDPAPGQRPDTIRLAEDGVWEWDRHG